MLKKDNIILQPIEEKHLPFLVKWGNVGGLHTQAANKRRTSVVEQAAELVALSTDKTKQVFAVHIKHLNQPVGICEIYNIDLVNRTCYINLHLEDKENVLGVYGFAILKIMLGYLYRRLGLYKVSADVLLESNLDIALFKQLNFKTEIRKRKHAFLSGGYKTVLEMSLLKHDFDKTYTL
jgi:RimJ/RimL family protein N-acetyltransferase